MDFDDLEAGITDVLMARMGTHATVTVPGDLPQATVIEISRSATVTDDYGIVIEERCEIGLLVKDTGPGTRGTLVDTGKPDDCWQLLEQIGNDGFESRWTAGKA